MLVCVCHIPCHATLPWRYWLAGRGKLPQSWRCCRTAEASDEIVGVRAGDSRGLSSKRAGGVGEAAMACSLGDSRDYASIQQPTSSNGAVDRRGVILLHSACVATRPVGGDSGSCARTRALVPHFMVQPGELSTEGGRSSGGRIKSLQKRLKWYHLGDMVRCVSSLSSTPELLQQFLWLHRVMHRVR